jgi:acetyl-CoA carboxylase carboxyl transferase subunit beta
MTTTRNEVPALSAEPDWTRCAGCGEVLFRPRLQRLRGVCPVCGGHARLTATERIDQLLDAGSAMPLPVPGTTVDPLGFVDSTPYVRRLARARERAGYPDAVRCVRGRIGGRPVVAAVMDFGFLGGSLGCHVGEMITQAAEAALADRIPLLLVTASGGARMQEGALSLMQMGKTAQALGELDRAGVLTISLVTDPTFGGVAASFATLCDVVLVEQGARMGFAGRRVIQQTIGEDLPDHFQSAGFLLDHGLVDAVCHRAELRDRLHRLLVVADRAGPSAAAPGPRPASLVVDPEQLGEADPWATVRAARGLGRPTVPDIVEVSFTGFVELKGDRQSADCPAVLAGVGVLRGIPVAVVGTRKSHTAGGLAAVRYGMPGPAGYRKAARVMRLAGKLGLPVVGLVDTPGAFPGRAAEEQGQAHAIAENLRLLAGLPVPVVSIVIGEGGSGGALALSVADRVLMCANAVYSVISPEGCAAILWDDPAAAPAAARALRLDARSLLEHGVVDGVVREPEGGSAAAPDVAIGSITDSVVWELTRLLATDQAERMRCRRERWRAFGAPPAHRPEGD